MREIIHLNFDWKFGLFLNQHLVQTGFDQLQSVNLPHHAVELPYNHFNENDLFNVFSYVKTIYIDQKWRHKILKLRFEGSAHETKVYINGQFAGQHIGGYTPFEIQIDPFVKFDEDNTILVVVDSHENPLIPPFGGRMDYLGYAGIYREVSLLVLNKAHILDVYVENRGESSIKLHIKTSVHQGFLNVKITSDQRVVHQKNYEIKSAYNIYYMEIDNPKLWDLDHPHLYQLDVDIVDTKIIDSYQTRFGIRHIEFRKDAFFLNGKQMKIMGLNRHQSYPYVGYAMPKRAQVEDADILKYELGLNMVRTSHYPQSTHFLNRCDEIGLLVFEELPGWQHIGNEIWQENSLNDLKEMILRDRNHPSIAIWGVRINESSDHHIFYTKTNELAKRLDPTRALGGVRNFSHSDFLEDVYTYNDFSHTGRNPGLAKKKSITGDVSYLITEFNGHMFPTKKYDNENHRIEHLKRHLNVINAMMEPNNGISGAIGWVMNDYQTHKEFGSGDKICYHGVLDMYRLPKLASLAYQVQYAKVPILEVTSNMNIGDYASGHIDLIYVMTNLDYVKLYKNDTYVNVFYQNKKQYPHLINAPIMIDDLIGEMLEKNENMTKKDAKKTKQVLKAVTAYGNKLPLSYKIKMLFLMKKYKLSMDDAMRLYYEYVGGWGSEKTVYRFDGYVNDQLTKTVILESNHSFDIILESNDQSLTMGETYDVKRYVVKKVNQHKQIVDYAFDPVLIEVSGAIELIGPSSLALISGSIAFWVRSKEKGIGQVSIRSNQYIMTKEVEVL